MKKHWRRIAVAIATPGLALTATLTNTPEAKAADTITVLRDNVRLRVDSSNLYVGARSNRAIQVSAANADPLNIRPINERTKVWHVIYNRDLKRCLTAPPGTNNGTVAVWRPCDRDDPAGNNRPARQSWKFIPTSPEANSPVVIGNRAYRNKVLTNRGDSENAGTRLRLTNSNGVITQYFSITNAG